MAKKAAAKRSSMRDAAKKRAEERQSTGGGGTKFIFPEGQAVQFFKPEKGKMKLDILPYEVTVDNHPVVAKGDFWYQRTIFVHHNIGAEEKAYLCLKTIGKKCPICEYRAKLVKSPDSDEDIIKALTPKEREVFNVMDLNDEKAGIQLWEFSYHLFGKLLETEIREGDDDLAGFADLEGGKTLEVRFKEKKMGKNTFLEADRIDFKDRDDYDEDILEDVLDLDAILNVLSYDKLDAIFTDLEDEDEKPAKGKGKKAKDEEEEDEEDEKPSRSSKKSKGKSKPDPEDDEDDEEEKPKRGKKASKKPDPEDEEDDEEEEQKKPSRSSKGKSKAKPEPEDEEDEEEEEKPSKSSKKSKKSSDDEECPHDGTFGEDCDELDECFECELFEACQAKHDELAAAKKKKKK